MLKLVVVSKSTGRKTVTTEASLCTAIKKAKEFIRNTNVELGYSYGDAEHRRNLEWHNYDIMTFTKLEERLEMCDLIYDVLRDHYYVAAKVDDDRMKRNHWSYIKELENMRNKILKAIHDKSKYGNINGRPLSDNLYNKLLGL